MLKVPAKIVEKHVAVKAKADSCVNSGATP